MAEDAAGLVGHPGPFRAGVQLRQAALRGRTGRRTPIGETAGRGAGTRPPGSVPAPGGRCAGTPREPSTNAAGSPSRHPIRARRPRSRAAGPACRPVSRLRPSTRKRQASSRLMVDSVRPAMIAARSRTKRKKPYGADPPAQVDLAGQGVVGGVEGLPHLRADGLAHASGVGAGRGERRHDGARVGSVERQELGDLAGRSDRRLRGALSPPVRPGCPPVMPMMSSRDAAGLVLAAVTGPRAGDGCGRRGSGPCPRPAPRNARSRRGSRRSGSACRLRPR